MHMLCRNQASFATPDAATKKNPAQRSPTRRLNTHRILEVASKLPRLAHHPCPISVCP